MSGAWDGVPQLKRKLEMRRRAAIRRKNRAERKRRLLEAAIDHAAHMPGAALVVVRSGAV